MIKVASCQMCWNLFKFEARPSRPIAKFCSHSCRARLYFTGSRNPNWKGGRSIHEAGYILVKAPENHPHKTKAGYIREHRLIMEQKLGRYLLLTEDIDHINGNKTDNRPENLQLVPNRSEHLKLEHRRGVYTEHLSKLNGGALA